MCPLASSHQNKLCFVAICLAGSSDKEELENTFEKKKAKCMQSLKDP